MVPALSKRDGHFRLNPFKSFAREKAIREEAAHVLESVGLQAQLSDTATAMSRGDKRRLELAMGLIQHPRLLLLDEPTAGMARHDTNATIDLLKQIKEGGMTKVIIEHDMHVVFSLADRISVLAGGRIIAQGTPDESRTIPRLKKPISGRNRYECCRKFSIAPRRQPADVGYFSVENINAFYGDSYIVQDVSFDVNEGEIVALSVVTVRERPLHCGLLPGLKSLSCAAGRLCFRVSRARNG